MGHPQRRRVGLGVVVGLGTFATLAVAQQPPTPLVVRPLTGGVYWTQGGAGGNTGIIIGQTGVIVVDAKTTPDSAREVLAEIAKLTPKPVTHAILTHSDGDHVNGLAAFPAGITVIAHEGNKKEQEAALAGGGRGAPPRDRLPTQVITRNRESLTIDGVNIVLLHWVPAHTSGDLVVYLPSQKIVFTGDIIAANRPDPNIHLEKNGSSEGWIETAKGIVALDADRFVPGHGDLQTKADVQKRLTDSEAKRAKIKALVAQGKALDEIKQAMGEASAVRAPGAGAGPGPTTYIDTVYQELTKK